MPFFIQIKPGDAWQPPTPDDFTPWISKEAGFGSKESETVALAAHKFIRERGGILPDDPPFTFTVYAYSDKDPTHPNGRPMTCRATTFVLHPK